MSRASSISTPAPLRKAGTTQHGQVNAGFLLTVCLSKLCSTVRIKSERRVKEAIKLGNE